MKPAYAAATKPIFQMHVAANPTLFCKMGNVCATVKVYFTQIHNVSNVHSCAKTAMDQGLSTAQHIL
jgi:hypothetical protein